MKKSGVRIYQKFSQDYMLVFHFRGVGLERLYKIKMGYNANIYTQSISNL